MWIARQVYQAQHDEWVRTAAKLAAVEGHNVALQTTMDWQRLRLTQLEHERAQLIFNYMGVKIAVPEVEHVPVRGSEGVPLGGAFDQPLSFDDVGDAVAKKLGLDWNSKGEVVHNGKVIS